MSELPKGKAELDDPSFRAKGNRGLSDQLWRERALHDERLRRETPLRAHITELEGKLAEISAVLATAREALETLPPEALGSGRTSEGMEYPLRDELINAISGALRPAAPSAQALTRLVEAVGRTVEAFERDSSKEEHAALAKEVTAAYHTLLTARTGREEE